MFKGRPLESVADANRRAKKRLPPAVYCFIHGGSQAGITARENVEAFSRIHFRPRIGIHRPEPGTSVELLGMKLSMPIILSPVAAHGLHSGGEVAINGAAASAGIAYALSNFASEPVEPVAAVNQHTLVQIYWIGSRDRMLRYLERAWSAGVRVLIFTMDWTHAHARDWRTPPLPGQMDMKTVLRHSPQLVTRPRWVFDLLTRGGLPRFSLPNFASPERKRWTFMDGMVEWMRSPLPTWQDVAWLRGQWKGSLIIKGVIHPDDAKRCVDSGADALSVSNHGGNNLDGTVPTIEALPPVVRAVDGQIVILADGGIRRGADVVKALALGAKAVLIGRPYAWAFGARGEDGVREILEVFRSDIHRTLCGLGVASVTDLRAEHVVMPATMG